MSSAQPNILCLTRTHILQYVNKYNMQRFKDQPYGLDYESLFDSRAQPVVEGDRIEQFYDDLIQSGCNDLIDYTQVTPIILRDNIEENSGKIALRYIFAKKDFVNAAINSNFLILDDIIDLIAKRDAVSEHIDKFDAGDRFEGSETFILDDQKQEYSDYFYDTIESTVMNAISKELGISNTDNHTWVALIDYVVAYVAETFSAALDLRTLKYQKRIKEILREKAVMARIKDVDSSSIQNDIDTLFKIQNDLRLLSESSKNLSRYFNNRSFAFTEEVMDTEIERLKSDSSRQPE